MTWQTVKEGKRTWVLLAIIDVLAVMFAYFFLNTFRDVSLFSSLFLVATALSAVAAASVFGLENRARTQQFLTHHGARPGLVWLVKLAVWVMGLALIWAPLVCVALITLEQSSTAASWYENWRSTLLIIPLYFAVPLLCGMAIRRSITALVIGLATTLLITLPLGALVAVNMLPVPGLLVIPLGLLIVSRARAADWLFDRMAPRRWARLSLLLAGMITVIVSWYAGYRAWSIRDIGPIAPPTVWSERATPSLIPHQNAAGLYGQAGHQLVGPFKNCPKFLRRNRRLLDLLKLAAARLHCQFLQPEAITLLDQPDVPPVHQPAALLTLDATGCQNNGDLPAAWDDIRALFRMAHHFGTGSRSVLAFPNGLVVECDALNAALQSPVAPGQKPEQLRSAMTAYADLPKMPSTLDIVRAEANVIERTLNLPKTQLRNSVVELANHYIQSQEILNSAMFDLATMP